MARSRTEDPLSEFFDIWLDGYPTIRQRASGAFSRSLAMAHTEDPCAGLFKIRRDSFSIQAWSSGNPQESRRYVLCKTAAYVLATTQSPNPGDGNWTPALWLDSGATHHAVGEASVLCELKDPPAEKAVRMADGVRRLPVTKVGNIWTENIKVPDVYFVPGLQMNVISVRQLAKSKIIATFYEHHAELWREGEQVGGAIADDSTSLYRLCYLAVV